MKSEIYDSKEAFCAGLKKGVAIRKLNDKPVYIEYALAHKDLAPFYCPECFCEALTRECSDKANHYFHKAIISDAYGSEESELHNNCKNEICDALKISFPNGKWEIERPIKPNPEKDFNGLVPDISGRIRDPTGALPSGIPLIIEVQRSYLNINTIIKRTSEYKKLNAYILWIVPLKKPIGNEFFRPRLFERFLHTFYCGRVYYWVEGFGLNVDAVHYGGASRYIPESTWYSESGEEMSFGGYDATFRTLKNPVRKGLMDISKDFIPQKLPEFVAFKKKKKKVPARNAFIDVNKKWWTNKIKSDGKYADLISERYKDDDEYEQFLVDDYISDNTEEMEQNNKMIDDYLATIYH